MAKKTSTIDIEVGYESFFLFKKFGLGTSATGEMEKLAQIRSLLNTEKARILHVIKTNKPDSLYKLARILGRDFQSVKKDCQLLKQLGILEFERGWTGRRKSTKPVLNLDKLQINISF
jgi:predicted transcriptional regulator